MESHEMSYNSQQQKLVIPEYGRNIQNLIFYAKEIEDDKTRQAFAEKIIDLMQQMNPQNKNVVEYKERLWGHLFRIAEYEINVVPPTGDIPTREEYSLRPEPLKYPVNESKFRHYGHYVQVMIKKAIEMPEGEKKQAFIKVIGAYMKLAYRTWNKEHYVNDETIKEDLKSLSDGIINLSDDVSLDNLTGGSLRKRQRSNNQSHGSKSRPQKGKRRR